MLCPVCRKPGKGKCCACDGTELVPAKNLTQPINSMPGAAPKQPAQGPEQRIPQSILKAPPEGQLPELHLINRTLGLDIVITKEVTIGREKGDLKDIFEKHSAVSRCHAQITYEVGTGWIVTDQNSSNGTKYNKINLAPNRPQALRDKSLLQIANIEFIVQVSDQNGPSSTGTVRM
jgi:pSer/pThr/pTyr-binding forkhead associated (FHA) protein